MKHGGKMLVCLVSGLAVCTTTPGVPVNSLETSGNPYQSIVDRNVFSLKPPPPQADPVEVNKPTALKITLTGITTILGNKRVLMKTPPPPSKPGQGQPQTEQSYILTEGQREGEIEVLEIDERAGSVKVNNAGSIQTLTFEKDGAKLPSTPAPAMPGMAPGQTIPGLPAAHPQVHLPSPAGTVAPNFQLPTRVPRLPSTGGQTGAGLPSASGINFSPAGAPAYAGPGLVTGGQTVSAPGATTTTPIPSSQMSVEEQMVWIETQRQLGGSTAALLPPTPLTSKLSEQNTQAPQAPTINLPPIPGRAPGSY
jgi:hypothetical protein